MPCLGHYLVCQGHVYPVILLHVFSNWCRPQSRYNQHWKSFTMAEKLRQNCNTFIKTRNHGCLLEELMEYTRMILKSLQGSTEKLGNHSCSKTSWWKRICWQAWWRRKTYWKQLRSINKWGIGRICWLIFRGRRRRKNWSRASIVDITKLAEVSHTVETLKDKVMEYIPQM